MRLTLLLVAATALVACQPVPPEPSVNPEPPAAGVVEVDGGAPSQGAGVDGGTKDAGTVDAGAPDAGSPDAGTPDAGSPDAGTPVSSGPLPCNALYAQDLLPTFNVEITQPEWAKLEDEFLHREDRVAAGLDPHPWHPIVFHYGSESFPDAMIRLKGQSSWRLTVENDPNPKMQFVISFNEVNKDGRFRGLRKLVLDMPRNDRTFIRQRLALSLLRDLGLPAQCANNALLEINGTYYGLYANLENMDKEYVQRIFPKDDDGDLWKSGNELKTNEDTSSHSRRNALFTAEDAQDVDALVDLQATLTEWAAEALMPDGDGYFAGTQNFYLYDHPKRGFQWLAFDLDGAFDFIPYDSDPLFYRFAPQKGLHWRVVLSDPAWQAAFVARLGELLKKYDVSALRQRIDTWSAQVHEAAEHDPHRPFTMEENGWARSGLKSFLTKRRDFVSDYVACRQSGGADADGDGTDWCHDCDDTNASVHPGAIEVCGNAVDDNCNLEVDEQCGP